MKTLSWKQSDPLMLESPAKTGNGLPKTTGCSSGSIESLCLYFRASPLILTGEIDVKISYSQDVDALLVELSDAPIAYAEDDGSVILYYSEDDKLVLIEILDFRHWMSDETVTALLAS